MDQPDDRFKKIEDRLTAIENRLGITPLPQNVPPTPPLTLIKPTPGRLNLWIKENWLASIGIFLVLLAGSWFIGYAFSNDWLGATARTLLCGAVGLITYIWGFSILQKQPRSAQALIVLGEAILFLSLFAASQFYSLLPESVTFGIMVTIAAITALIAILYNLEGLGFAAIVSAMIIPLMVYNKNFSISFLLSYVLLVDVAALAMFLTSSWGWVFHIAWFATLIHSFTFYFSYEKAVITFFSTVFYLLFFLPTALTACGKIERKLPLKGAMILFTSTFALIAWIDNLSLFKWNILIYAAAALLSFYFSYIMTQNWMNIHYNRPRLKYCLGIILGFSVMTFSYLAIRSANIIYQFDGETLSYFVLISAAIAIAHYILKAPMAALGLAFYFLFPLVDVWNYLPRLLQAPFYSLDFATLFISTLSVGSACWIIYISHEVGKSSLLYRIISGCLAVLTAMLLMSLIWNICYNTIPNSNIARGVALVIYVLAAEILIYIGNSNHLKNLRFGGIAIIIFVIYRLLSAEVWDMPVIIRTITFVVTGILLIGTAWFDKKKGQ